MTEELKQKAEAEADKVIIGSGMDRASVIHLKHLLVTMYMQGATEVTEELQEENAELKKELAEKGQHLDLTEREWGKDTTKLIHYKTQLTKAKEIIKELLNSCFGYSSKTVNYEVKAKAEAFMKE